MKHSRTPTRVMLDDFLADKTSTVATLTYVTARERVVIETTAKQLRSFGHAIDTITVDTVNQVVIITRRTQPRPKMIMFQGHPFTVISETSADYVCKPVNQDSRRYIFAPKDKATVLDTDEAGHDE